MPKLTGNAFLDLAPPTLQERKARMLAAVNERLAAILAGGYSHNFGGEIGIKVLQTRDIEDRTNWLTSQGAYAAAIAAEQGAVEGAVFRTEDNVIITMSYSAGHAVLLAMAAWGAGKYGQSWTLKDAISAAADDAALDAVDIESGLPG